jgi:hypothetical protein
MIETLCTSRYGYLYDVNREENDGAPPQLGLYMYIILPGP